MRRESPIWLGEAEVRSLLTLEDAIPALERGLEREARGEARNLEKTHLAWDGGTLHAIGAAFVRDGIAGVKTWAHTAGGATPLLVLFDARDGSLRAIIEAFALGQMRTAAVSGVATRWLAAPDARELAILGTGRQALSQVAAVAAVRPLERVRVYSPNAEHRARFASRVGAELGLVVVDCATVAEAVDGAAIVTLATRAREPVLVSEMISRGCHVNAIGAITPERMEFSPAILDRCGRVVVDSRAAVERLSWELRDYYGAGRASWDEVLELSGVVAHRQSRPPDTDLTLFKSMGTGIADLSVAIEVYDRAACGGVGRRFPHPEVSP